ncbi:MAG: adenylate/guanylate cyclase domain-containing protein [Acidimicrobiia bacterium]
MIERDSQQTVLFADLAGFTALTEAHGDLDAADVATRFSALTISALAGETRLVKTIGDAVMLAGTGPESMVTTALALLRAVDEEPFFPTVRIGVHSGPVVEREGDLYGATVNLAARLAAHAHAGEILATGPVVAQLSDSRNTRVSSLGELTFKNVPAPIEVFSIEDPTRAIDAETTDPVCHMVVDADDAPARLPYGDRRYFFCSFACAQKFAEHPERYVAVA